MTELNRRTVLAGLAAATAPLPSAPAAAAAVTAPPVAAPVAAIPLSRSYGLVDYFGTVTTRQMLRHCDQWIATDVPGWGLAPGFAAALEHEGDAIVLAGVVEIAQLDRPGFCFGHGWSQPEEAIGSRKLWLLVEPTGNAGPGKDLAPP